MRSGLVEYVAIYAGNLVVGGLCVAAAAAGYAVGGITCGLILLGRVVAGKQVPTITYPEASSEPLNAMLLSKVEQEDLPQSVPGTQTSPISTILHTARSAGLDSAYEPLGTYDTPEPTPASSPQGPDKGKLDKGKLDAAAAAAWQSPSQRRLQNTLASPLSETSAGGSPEASRIRRKSLL